MIKEQLFTQLVELLSDEKLFHGHGVIDAEDEAMMILIKLLEQNVDKILQTGTDVVSKQIQSHAIQIIEQRLSTLKPMAYILGEVNFCNLMFNCDERALVPRSPIAELIQKGFIPWVEMEKIKNVLDLCTGGGCIGISIAHYFKHTTVDISDLSHKALALAQENILKLNVKVNTIQSDLFNNVKTQYDLIVTNPPYVSEQEYQQLPQEYQQEPKLGLVTEAKGLRIPVKILAKAAEFLNDDGYLFLEVGYSDEALDSAFPTIDMQWIDFSNGGQGVCVFTKKMLLEYQSLFKTYLTQIQV